MAGVVTYYSYDLTTNTLLATLPLTGVTFSQRLNSSGSLSATLNMADKRVQKLDPQDATRPSRTLLVVDIDTVIVWAGIIWTRKRVASSWQVQIGANEVWSYFSRRLQWRDYTTNPGGTYWNTDPADAGYIAAELVVDVSKSAGSPFYNMGINVNEAFTNTNTITASYPLSSGATVDSMVNTLSAQGYLTGFDFAVDVSWSAGQGSTPSFSWNASYPRRGRVAGTTGLTLHASFADYEWDEDGTKQANSINASASGAATLTTQAADANVQTAGYPLLEQRSTFTAINNQAALQSAAQGQLATIEWPVVTALVNSPTFGDPFIGEYIMGDDVNLVIEPDWFFPSGLNCYLRITGADHTIADQGLSTTKFTLTNLLGLAPVSPPPL